MKVQECNIFDSKHVTCDRSHHRPSKKVASLKRNVQTLAEDDHSTYFHPFLLLPIPLQNIRSSLFRTRNGITITKLEPEGQPQTWTASRLNFHNLGLYFLPSASIMWWIPFSKRINPQIQRGWRHIHVSWKHLAVFTVQYLGRPDVGGNRW